MATSKGPPPPGSIWTQRTTSQTSGWTGSGVSANGKYSIINGLNYAGNDGYVLYSTNFGVTWNEAASGESGTFSKGSCVSDNGAIMAYTSGTTNTIRLSTNGGLTFSAVGPTSPTIKEWANICCSSDGSIMYAYDVGNYGNGYQGAIYKSINSGATWSNIGSPASAILTAPATYYASICCSPDGTKVAITVYNYGGGIWISTNSGSTWSEKTGMGSAGGGWYHLSANQTSLLLVDVNNALWYSPDWGTTWAQVASNGSLYRTSISRDGSLALYCNNSRIYVSKNIGLTGTTFTAVGPTGGWNAIACSSNGNVIIAGSSGSYVYSSP